MKAKNIYKIKSVAVWLVLDDPEYSGKVVLQKRASTENNKKQSFVGVYQPAINGKIENKETIISAINREAKEELGPNFKLPKIKLFDKSEYIFKGEKCLGYNYYGKITKINFKKIILHKAAEKLILVDKLVLQSNKEIVLFADQLQALNKLFVILENQSH